MWSQVGLWTNLVEVMEFQLSYFKSLKLMLWKCCTQYTSKFGKQQWPQDWERSVFIPIPKKGNAEGCSNYHTIALISHAGEVILKILQARLQQYVNRELPDVQTGFSKGRETRDQIANIHGIIEKPREFQKNICFLLTISKPWLCGSQQTVENSSRDGKTRPPYLPSAKPICRSRSSS